MNNFVLHSSAQTLASAKPNFQLIWAWRSSALACLESISNLTLLEILRSMCIYVTHSLYLALTLVSELCWSWRKSFVLLSFSRRLTNISVITESRFKRVEKWVWWFKDDICSSDYSVDHSDPILGPYLRYQQCQISSQWRRNCNGKWRCHLQVWISMGWLSKLTNVWSDCLTWGLMLKWLAMRKKQFCSESMLWISVCQADYYLQVCLNVASFVL